MAVHGLLISPSLVDIRLVWDLQPSPVKPLHSPVDFRMCAATSEGLDHVGTGFEDNCSPFVKR